MDFMSNALDVFRFQAASCETYRLWIELLGIDPSRVTSVEQIPFMPIEFFRTRKVYCAANEPQVIFESSGTTGGQTSRHYVASTQLYERSFVDCFTHFYGDMSQYKLETMLPSYRPQSSLLHMTRRWEELFTGERVFLLGVTFALLDAVRNKTARPLPKGSIVMETGGMKGRYAQIERQELHAELCEGFGVEAIHSEYGMCELMSQAYSTGGGLFRPSPSMRVVARRADIDLRPARCNEVGGLNIIDLNNRYSCSFIATGDKGVVYEDGSFEVLGRLENEILRGCNMLQ